MKSFINVRGISSYLTPGMDLLQEEGLNHCPLDTNINKKRKLYRQKPSWFFMHTCIQFGFQLDRRERASSSALRKQVNSLHYPRLDNTFNTMLRTIWICVNIRLGFSLEASSPLQKESLQMQLCQICTYLHQFNSKMFKSVNGTKTFTHLIWTSIKLLRGSTTAQAEYSQVPIYIVLIWRY